MNKVTYWVFGFVGVGIVIALIITITIMNNTGEQMPPATISDPYPDFSPTVVVPSTSDTEGPETNTKIIATQSGSVIVVKDFLQESTVKNDSINPDHYYLGYYIDPTDPTASSTPPYVIEYIETTQYFSIALLQEPLNGVRQQAEQYLMEQLGVTADQMCQLKYTVSVPLRISQLYASENLGFSFCPGATPL